jgi:hypothetical protein
LQFDGVRPGTGWHAHGYCSCGLTFIEGERLVHRRLYKRRWLDPATGKTTHSRPPDALPYFSASTVLVVIALAVFLGMAVPEVGTIDVEELRSRRTFERWRHRAAGRALHVQQAIRHALIERCEPRPVEFLFKGGCRPRVHRQTHPQSPH